LNPDKALPWVAERLKLTFADSQTTAIRQALACKVLVITGCPASAKPPSSRAFCKLPQQPVSKRVVSLFSLCYSLYLSY
jgi:hypothetical protein